MKATIIVKGNIWGDIAPSFIIDGVTFDWHDPTTIIAESSTLTKDTLQDLLPQIQPRLFYQLLAPIQLYISERGGDIKLSDPRVFYGPAASPHLSSDIPLIRNWIVEHELAAGNASRTLVLRADISLLYALEHFIRAILTSQYLLPELYKAIEAIKHSLGSWNSFSSIGFTKGYLDYVKQRANSETDERHAPSDIASVSPVPQVEIKECLIRTREIIIKYADSL